MTYAPAQFNVASKGLGEGAFTKNYKVKVTCNVAQYPLHHVTCAPAKFEVTMSRGLEDVFTIKST